VPVNYRLRKVMNMKKYGLVLLALLAVPAVLLMAHRAGSEADPRVDAILGHQRTYFAAIKSLEFSSKEIIRFSDEARAASGGKTPAVLRNDLRFACVGPLYRSEVEAYKEEGTPVTVFTTLRGAADHIRRVKYPGQAEVQGVAPENDDYCAANMLVGAFDFALMKGDAHAIAALSTAGKWDAVASAVTAAADQSLMGHDGVLLTLRATAICGDQEQVRTVFFASDLGDFPLYWKAANPDGSYSECKVTQTRSLALPEGATMVFPRRVESTFYADGKLWSQSVIELDSDSLKVNGPVDVKTFADCGHRVGVFSRAVGAN